MLAFLRKVIVGFLARCMSEQIVSRVHTGPGGQDPLDLGSQMTMWHKVMNKLKFRWYTLIASGFNKH